MRKEHRRKLARYVRRSYYRSLWNKFVRVMACVVVFCTTYALILPAITAEREYLCAMDEHIHSPECYAEMTELQQVCDLPEEPEGHLHTESCWMEFSTQVLSCTLPEHTHVSSCKNDPNADLETAAVWESTLSHVVLTGGWDKDLVAIAQSQLGYRESTANRDLDTGKGYSRYGAWYGIPYGTWDAMFASFCLHYAGIPQEVIPKSWDSLSWLAELGENQLTADYMAQFPVVGDLLFYTEQNDTQVKTAIVTNVLPEEETTWLTLIEGDSQDQVCQNRVDISDIAVLASCHLPSVQQRYEAQKNAITDTQWDIQGEEASVLPAAQEEEGMTWEVFAETSEPTIPQKIQWEIEDNETEPVPTQTQFSPLIPEAIWEVVDEVQAPQPTEEEFTVTRMVETENYVVMVEYASGLVIPEGAQLRATEYPRDSEIFRKRCEEAGYELEWLMNIGFFIGDEEVILNGTFDVVVTSKQGQSLGQDITHFADHGTERINGEAGQSSVSFSADSFSDFGGGTARAAGDAVITGFQFTTVDPWQLQENTDYVIYTGNGTHYNFMSAGKNSVQLYGSDNYNPYQIGGTWSVDTGTLGTSQITDMAWRVVKSGNNYYLQSRLSGNYLQLNNGWSDMVGRNDASLLRNTYVNGAAAEVGNGTYHIRYEDNGGWKSTWYNGSNYWTSPTRIYFATVTPIYESEPNYPDAVYTGDVHVDRLRFYNLCEGANGISALAGCVFQVEGVTSTGQNYSTTIVSDNSPQIALPSNIPDGKYTITEVSAPEGYMRELNNQREFWIENGMLASEHNIGTFLNHAIEQLTVQKTGEVEDYNNRLYQVLLNAKTNMHTYRMDPIHVLFVVDKSNSMLFPSGMNSTGKTITLRLDGQGNVANNQSVLDSLDKSIVHYIIADPEGTATVYAIWYDGTAWLYQDASYYAKAKFNNSDGYESDSEVVIFPGDRSYGDQSTWEDNTYGTEYRSNGGGLNHSLSGSTLGTYIDKVNGQTGENNNGYNSRTFTVYTAKDEYNRLHYLEEALANMIYELADANPANTVTLIPFTKTVQTDLYYPLNTQNKVSQPVTLSTSNVEMLEDIVTQINTTGGTRQDLALEHAYNTYLQNTSNPDRYYTILITDGAPVGTSSLSTETIYGYIRNHAENVRDKSTLMTVALGMDFVEGGKKVLQDIATPGDFYCALDDASALTENMQRILFDSLIAEGEMEIDGSIVDEISDSFYPIAWTYPNYIQSVDRKLLCQSNDKAWILLNPGDWITLDGRFTTAGASDAAGQLLQKDDGTMYIQWQEQPVSGQGWNGTFYVKAKEDFMGGNAIDTNKSASVTVHDATKNMPIPTVNVHLLDMTQQSSEVTVYLGDLINAEGDAPIDTLKEFFAETDIIKLISDGGNVLNATTADGTKLKDATFTLEYAMGRNLTDDEWTRLMNGESIRVQYTYDDPSSHGPVGEFTFRLEKTGITGSNPSYEVHEATAACRPNGADCYDAAAETYTLNVRYDAYELGENGRPNANANNSGPGPGREVGTGTTLATGIGSVVKPNVHKVHVLSGSIVITKRFEDGLTSDQDETFTFIIRRLEDGATETRTITIPAGQSRGSADITLTNLKRGTYTITEAPDAEEVYTLESATVLNSGGYKTNAHSTPAIGESAMEVTFVLGHNTANHNVIGKNETSDPYTSYIYPVTGVNGAAEFVNKELVFYGEIPVVKAWGDGAENHTDDAVYLVLYLNGDVYKDENGYARLLRLDASNNWQDKFTVVLADQNDSVLNYDYSVREVTAVTTDSNYTAWQKAILENDGETLLRYERAVEQNGILGVGGAGYIVQYTAWDDGAWTVTNLKSYDLPETGGVGTHPYTISGLLLMAAALIFGYSRRRKRERGAAA